MTLGSMREQGVHHPIAFCHNDACRHQALIDVSRYTDVALHGRSRGAIVPAPCQV
jgi:hypothetical protein